MQFWDRYFYYPPNSLKEEIQSKTYKVEMDFIDKLHLIIQNGIQKKRNQTIERSQP